MSNHDEWFEGLTFGGIDLDEFSPHEFNTDADMTTLGEKLAEKLRCDYEEHQGVEWTDAPVPVFRAMDIKHSRFIGAFKDICQA